MFATLSNDFQASYFDIWFSVLKYFCCLLPSASTEASASSASISSSILVRSPTILVRARAQRDVFNSVFCGNENKNTKHGNCVSCTVRCTCQCYSTLPSRMPYVLSSRMTIHFSFFGLDNYPLILLIFASTIMQI